MWVGTRTPSLLTLSASSVCSWVRRELHCWVFDNVRAKWPTVVRRPSRLPGLFSGYHAPNGLVHAVLRAVGVRQEDLAAETAAIGVRVAVLCAKQHVGLGPSQRGWPQL